MLVSSQQDGWSYGRSISATLALQICNTTVLLTQFDYLLNAEHGQAAVTDSTIQQPLSFMHIDQIKREV